MHVCEHENVENVWWGMNRSSPLCLVVQSGFICNVVSMSQTNNIGQRSTLK